MDLRCYDNLPSPCYVIDEAALEKNLKIMDSVQQESGCRIILALKAFALFPVSPLIQKYLCGVTASSINEARLGREEFGGEVHVCCPAYVPDEFDELLSYVDHIVFNSFSQLSALMPRIQAAGGNIECGIRVNPGHSEVGTELYDPCRKHSRLGVTAAEFKIDQLEGVTGLHFHSLCEVNADALARTLQVVEDKFGEALKMMEWVNFGGGHHITRDDYDLKMLCGLISDFSERHNVRVYLEPGEAIALNAGILVASVLDIVHNEMDVVILDTSASTHMPDIIEMPYRPEIYNAGTAGEFPYTCKLTGNTCLAGDIIGDYSFPEALKVGDRLVFLDMAHYTMVKNTTFNGINLPAIAVWRMGAEKPEVVRAPTYNDYKMRLG
ncbi:MAG: carboxynorspermidine decarboxylase [Kiritimatiellae bacterium]|nr:carboxynorspermidine decarboxylase [Kiritimatiellia bacterium]